MKVVKAPSDFPNPPHFHEILELEGVSVVESCTQVHDTKKVMFLEDHMLLFVLEGTMKIHLVGQHFEVNKGEMILLRKSLCIEAWKLGNKDNHYAFESMMFFLKDNFLVDFLKTKNIRLFRASEPARIFVRPFGERLAAFLLSLKSFFREKEEINASLYRLKMLELLYDLAHADKQLLLQLVQLKQQHVTDISKVMDENYLNPIALNDLAYLSGRSLSSFRRDFEAIYQTSPARWIQEKRMEKARELLTMTQMSVADVCYTVGYENLSHFPDCTKVSGGITPAKSDPRKFERARPGWQSGSLHHRGRVRFSG